MQYISFPGLGIEPFHINKTINIGKLSIAWYGIIICVGIILALAYGMYRARSEKIKTDDIIDLAIFLVLFGIIGARLYYVIFEFDNYLVTGQGFLKNLKDTFINIISVWNGGLAIYGALIAGFTTILVFCKIKKIKLLKLLDLAAPAVMIGQILGRWGNFVNVEAYGTQTELPWRMGIHTGLFADAAETGAWLSQIYVHPTFLYESLWNLVGFIVANVIYRKKKFDGQIFYFYIAWYGFGRMFIEGLRTDSLMIGDTVRVSQIVGLLTFIAGVVLTVVFARRAKQTRAAMIDGALKAVNCTVCDDSEESECDCGAKCHDCGDDVSDTHESEENNG